MGLKAPIKANVVSGRLGTKLIQVGEEKIQGYEVDMELKGPFGAMKTKSWFDKDCVAL